MKADQGGTGAVTRPASPSSPTGSERAEQGGLAVTGQTPWTGGFAIVE